MRLYFDECCSRRLADELREFYAVDTPDLLIAHVLDSYNAGTGDSTWLQPLKEEKSWIVITQDHGKDPKKEKLPLICRELGVTYVTFSPSIIRGGYKIQKTALVSVWGELQELHRLPKGTNARLKIGTSKGGIPRYELKVDGKTIASFLDA